MKNDNFEKKKKNMIITFSVMFLLGLANFVIQIIITILDCLIVEKLDLSNFPNVLIYAIITIFMFISIKLLRNNSISAGIIGIILAIIEILFAGVVWKLIGILLLVDSIIYLVDFNKKNNTIWFL